jgi:hypothetical protein
MPPTPQDRAGSVRSAAVLNEEIRNRWQRAGGVLDEQQRREYEQLVTEWAAAIRAETAVAEAA